MLLWLFAVGILSHSAAAFHRSIPLPVKCTCCCYKILSWSPPGIPFRFKFLFLYISKFSVEICDIPSTESQTASPSLGYKSHVCRPIFILGIWLGCRRLHDWKEGLVFLSVGEGIFSFKEKTDVRGFGWLPEPFRQGFHFAVIPVVVTAVCVDVL